MNNGKRGHKITLALLCAAFMLVFSLPMQADEPEPAVPVREIVFLLDASNSMNDLETNVAAQTVSLMAHSLTTDFKMGFVSFDTSVQAISNIESSAFDLSRVASSTLFKGYSNAGAGLTAALSLFSEGENIPQSVVLLSDGEIIMASDNATQEAIAEFQSAVAEAVNRDIAVNTIMIGKEGSVANVLTASENTGGSVHWANDREQILAAAEEILFTDLGIRQSAVAAGGAQNGRLSITLPDTEMELGKILLTSDFALRNVTAAANAADVRVTTGERYAVVDLRSPTQTGVSIAFDAVGEGNVQAKLIPEYRVTLDAQVDYPSSGSASSGKEPVLPPTLTVKATGGGNPGALWKSPVFDSKDVTLEINGKPYPAKIADGCAQITYGGDETGSYNVTADFSAFAGNFLSVVPAKIHSARPVVAPPPGIDYRPMTVILLLLALALVLVFMMGKRRTARRRPAQPTGVIPVGNKPAQSRFTGKLNIYVTQTPDDQDVAPQTFSLYRENRDKMRLHYVLGKCGIDLQDQGDNDILLRPGQDGALNIINNSNGTVLKSRELMVKGRSFDVYFEEKVTVIFDNGSEVVLHYKNVKPSERV